MCKSISKYEFKKNLKYKPVSISISVPKVYGEKLGQHYACFIGDNEWCEKRALPHRVDR